MSEIVLVERHGSSAILRMNRAEKQNALSRELFEAIDRSLLMLEDDAGVRGIVITGNEKVFSTGGDLKEALAIHSVEDTRKWLALFSRVKGRPLPPWAAELGIRSWAQYFLKWIVAHPALTCAIPGTGRPEHVRDNVAAGFGALPDAATRGRMTKYFDSL